MASTLHKVLRTPRDIDIELSEGPRLPHITSLRPLLRSKATGQSDLWEELKRATQEACSVKQPSSTHRWCSLHHLDLRNSIQRASGFH